MSPVFPYIMAWFVYVGLAICVLVIALGIAIPRQTRSLAKRLAAGICGSFPGVILFQIFAAPVVVLTLLMMWVVYAVFHPSDNWEGLLLIAFALLIFAQVAIASLAGFYTGFRIAWEFAAGGSVRHVFDTDKFLGPFMRLLRRHAPYVSRLYD